jgi:hypothetical protein
VRGQHIISFAILAALAGALWRPSLDVGGSVDATARIQQLTALLGSASTDAEDIETLLTSFGPFAPDAKAGRDLADTLIMCRTATLEELRQGQLARNLYAITTAADTDADVTAEIFRIGQMAFEARCDQATIDRMLIAARGVARADPRPRSDWW